MGIDFYARAAYGVPLDDLHVVPKRIHELFVAWDMSKGATHEAVEGEIGYAPDEEVECGICADILTEDTQEAYLAAVGARLPEGFHTVTWQKRADIIRGLCVEYNVPNVAFTTYGSSDDSRAFLMTREYEFHWEDDDAVRMDDVRTNDDARDDILAFCEALGMDVNESDLGWYVMGYTST